MGEKKPSRRPRSGTDTNSRPGIHELPVQPFRADMRLMEELMSDLQARLGGPRAARSRHLDQAQDLIHEAWENPNEKQRVAMAFQALALSPNCADAYVILAEATPSITDAMSFYLLGVSAGERAIGKKAFKELTGQFWGVLETRPYMRARAGLADCLRKAGIMEPAVDHYKEMLHLNPNDNQGIRDILSSCLLELGRDEELGALLKQYEKDGSATWKYTGAILAFRQVSDSAQSREALATAMESNAHVPVYLLGKKRIPRELPSSYSYGGEDEAILYVAANCEGWKRTPGALQWLATCSRKQ